MAACFLLAASLAAACSSAAAPARPGGHTRPSGPLTGARLAAALLPASAFGDGLQSAAGARAGTAAGAATAVAALPCTMLAKAYSAGAAASAAEQFDRADPGDTGPAFREEAFQFPSGQGPADFDAYRARLGGPCVRFTAALGEGVVETVTNDTRAVGGAGDEAFLASSARTVGAAAPSYTSAVFIRYGDLVIVVTAQSRTAPADGDPYGLEAKALKIAANLGVS